MLEQNPYSSPVDHSEGVWDHTLFWRLFKITWGFVLLFAIIDVVVLTWGNLSRTNGSMFEIIVEQIQRDIKQHEDYKKDIERITKEAVRSLSDK